MPSNIPLFVPCAMRRDTCVRVARLPRDGWEWAAVLGLAALDAAKAYAAARDRR